jgi:hypothetical protein
MLRFDVGEDLLHYYCNVDRVTVYATAPVNVAVGARILRQIGAGARDGVKNQGMMGGAGNMAEMMNMIRQKAISRFSTPRCETSAVVAPRPGSARSELLWCTLPFLETKRRRTGVNLVSRS